MYYEFRFYSVAPWRLPDEMALVRNVAVDGAREMPSGPPAHAESLWDRYGVPRPVGSWITLTGRNRPRFLYVVPWSSLEERDARLPRFWTDPLWAARRADLTDGQTLVNSIDTWILSPLAEARALRDTTAAEVGGGIHELRVYDISAGDETLAAHTLATVDLPAAQAHGAHILGLMEVVLGPHRPRIVALLAWPDIETQMQAAVALDSTPQLGGLRDAATPRRGHPVCTRIDPYLLHPMSWNMPRPNLGALE